MGAGVLSLPYISCKRLYRSDQSFYTNRERDRDRDSSTDENTSGGMQQLPCEHASTKNRTRKETGTGGRAIKLILLYLSPLFCNGGAGAGREKEGQEKKRHR